MVDTAELYPVPLTAPEWQAGRTEEYIGTWLGEEPPMALKDCARHEDLRLHGALQGRRARTEPRRTRGLTLPRS